MSRKQFSYNDSSLLRDLGEEMKDARMGDARVQKGKVVGIEGEERSDGVRYLDGNRITPFNMKEEMREGDFDEDYNFVSRKNLREEEQQDAWLLEYESKHGSRPYKVCFHIKFAN